MLTHASFEVFNFESDSVLGSADGWTPSQTGGSNVSYVNNTDSRSGVQSFEFVTTTGIDQVYYNSFPSVLPDNGYIEGYVRHNDGNNDGLAIGSTASDPIVLGLSGGVLIDQLCTQTVPSGWFTGSHSGSEFVYQRIDFNNLTGQIKFTIKDETSDWFDCFSPFSTSVGALMMTAQSFAIFDDIQVGFNELPDFSFNGGFNNVLNTRFLNLATTTTGSSNKTDVTFDVSHFIDPSEKSSTTPEFNPTMVSFSLATNGNFSKSGIDIDPSQLTGFGTTSWFYNDLPDDTYDLLIQFSNLSTAFSGIVPFPNSYVYITFTTSGGDASFSDVEFYDSTSINEQTSSYKECSALKLSNCISNAFIFLFYPSDDVTNGFATLNSTLETKFPFAYLYDFSDSITGLFDTQQNQTVEITYAFSTYGDMTIISEDMLTTGTAGTISALVKLVLGYLLWIMFGLHMYRRVLKIFNPNPV